MVSPNSSHRSAPSQDVCNIPSKLCRSVLFSFRRIINGINAFLCDLHVPEEVASKVVEGECVESSCSRKVES